MSNKINNEFEMKVMLNWPEAQNWMEHPLATRVVCEEMPQLIEVPYHVLLQFPNGYYLDADGNLDSVGLVILAAKECEEMPQLIELPYHVLLQFPNGYYLDADGNLDKSCEECLN